MWGSSPHLISYPKTTSIGYIQVDLRKMYLLEQPWREDHENDKHFDFDDIVGANSNRDGVSRKHNA
jgi:hypothetical protein